MSGIPRCSNSKLMFLPLIRCLDGFGVPASLQPYRRAINLKSAHLIVVCSPPDALHSPVSNVLKIKPEDLPRFGKRNLSRHLHDHSDSVRACVMHIGHKLQNHPPSQLVKVVSVKFEGQSPQVRAVQKQTVRNEVPNTVVTRKTCNGAWRCHFTELCLCYGQSFISARDLAIRSDGNCL